MYRYYGLISLHGAIGYDRKWLNIYFASLKIYLCTWLYSSKCIQQLLNNQSNHAWFVNDYSIKHWTDWINSNARKSLNLPVSLSCGHQLGWVLTLDPGQCAVLSFTILQLTSSVIECFNELLRLCIINFMLTVCVQLTHFHPQTTGHQSS